MRQTKGMATLSTIVHEARKKEPRLGPFPAKHRVTGQEVTLLVIQDAETGGLMPVAILLDPEEALRDYIPPQGAGGYDEKGEVWEVRVPDVRSEGREPAGTPERVVPPNPRHRK